MTREVFELVTVVWKINDTVLSEEDEKQLLDLWVEWQGSLVDSGFLAGGSMGPLKEPIGISKSSLPA